MGSKGPKLYTRTMERLGMYVSTQFINCSDVKKCLMQEKLVKPSITVLVENHSAHKKREWEYQTSKLMINERLLKATL